MDRSVKGNAFWGPPTWKTIHSFAAAYNPKHAEAFKMFMYSMIELLPCEKCRLNLAEKLGKYPIDRYLSSNHELFYWTYILHDAVNQHNRKISPPYDEVKASYFDALGQECKECRI